VKVGKAVSAPLHALQTALDVQIWRFDHPVRPRSRARKCSGSRGRSSASITHGLRSACSVNAMDARPSSTDLTHDASIEPATASHDHSVCTCPS
jgi:hypothetical protein